MKSIILTALMLIVALNTNAFAQHDHGMHGGQQQGMNMQIQNMQNMMNRMNDISSRMSDMMQNMNEMHQQHQNMQMNMQQ
ncbi:MAG: hypothetical protein OZ930_12555, partial [Ignavibacteria bacterium]|nr:hypothetical protein [Ignavibacteria bacterium]